MEKGYHTMSSLLLLFVIYFFLVDNQKKMVGAEDAYIEISAIVDQGIKHNYLNSRCHKNWTSLIRALTVWEDTCIIL